MPETTRRRFLGVGAAIIGGAAASRPLAEGGQPTGAAEKLTNWAGNYEYSVDRVHEARSTGEVQELVRGAERLRALGTRHCFNGIADSRHNLVSVRSMAEPVALDAEARSVTVEAGASYGQLCPWLDERGFALHNLASLPHISIAGACATATHGSGVGNGNLATAVSGLELVTASGELRRISRAADPELFPGAVVHLGALGVLARVTLDVEPAYRMRQHVYLDLPAAELHDHFDEIMSAGYSVSLFTGWRGGTVDEVWVKSRVDDPRSKAEAEPAFFGSRPATRDVHPIVALSAEHCTAQLGVEGPWYERLPHFRMGFTPSSGDELQSEYFVPRANAVEAILAMERLGDQVAPHLYISELRSIAADSLWMSTAYGRDSLAIHFTWKPDWPAVRRLLPLIERELLPFGVRPHWGKLFTLPREELRQRYEKLGEFEEIVRELDPEGKFQNDFLATHL